MSKDIFFQAILPIMTCVYNFQMSMMEEISEIVDSSFKYIFIGFNFITLLILYLHKRAHPPKKQHHVLLLTAHPDDECMFFRPLLRSITKEYYVHLLCLSGGNTTREQELQKAATFLHLHKCTCLSNDKLQDGQKQKWCEDTIRNHCLTYIKQHQIKAIFTFDGHGVSGHPNHSTIYYALKQLEQNANPEQKQIKIYYLNSVNLLRKYTGVLEIVYTLLLTYSWHNLAVWDGYQAMAKHPSQFVWYRKLWLLFSRYSYINTFTRKILTIQ